MQSIIFWIVLAACLFAVALFFFFRAITKKSMQNIWYSLALVLIAGIMGARAGWLFMKKSYHAIVRSVEPTGIDVYESMFGKNTGCVHVSNKTLPVVPRIDCCTYLEFQTCPDELKRIIAQSRYEPATADTPPGNQPAWWKTTALGSGAKSLACSPDEDSYQLLVFSADSTHAFYCYSTD